MLLFIDESGHNKSGTPCEVLAGVAIAEDSLWNLVRAIRSAERDHFGNYMRDVFAGEMKAKKLLKPDRFHEAQRDVLIPADDCVALANSLLRKGKAARGQPTSDPTFLPKPAENGTWPLHGIVYLDDLRGHIDRENEQE